MIDVKKHNRYYTHINLLRGCNLKIQEKDEDIESVIMRPIRSYSDESLVMLVCDGISDEGYVIFSDYDTGYKVYGCSNLNQTSVKIPVESVDIDEIISNIKTYNHLWVSLENLAEENYELDEEFSKNHEDKNDVSKEVVGAIEKLDAISSTNIENTIKEIIDRRISLCHDDENKVTTSIPKNGNKKLGQIAI